MPQIAGFHIISKEVYELKFNTILVKLMSLTLKRKYYRIASYAIIRDKNKKVKKLSYCIEKRPPSNSHLKKKQKQMLNLVWQIHEELKYDLFSTKSKLYNHFESKSKILIFIDFEFGILSTSAISNKSSSNCKLCNLTV